MARQLCLAFLLCAALPLAVHAAIPLEACDSLSIQTVLHAAPMSMAARAVWLNRRLAKWPGALAQGSFKLYYSPVASISAPLNARVRGAAGALALDVFAGDLPAPAAARLKHLASGPVLAIKDADLARLPDLHRQQLVLVQEAPDGAVRAATRLQAAGALDDLYAAAASVNGLGVTLDRRQTAFRLWAPTARQAAVCVYDSGDGRASAVSQMQFDPDTGVWSAGSDGNLSGSYYRYAVDVVVDGMGVVRNLVTDPYSVSLTTDSKRSYIADLDAPALKPKGWDKAPAPGTVKAQTDMVVYELHVRDFSINDPTVSPAHRGKYLAFTETGSNGMKHLAALAKAGLTDVHLLPVYDIGSVPEQGCVVPKPAGAADSEQQQALTRKSAAKDCFNWGYDPYHYNAPEGSYSTDPADGARRILEVREMVASLHRAGLRVGMDVAYKHSFATGQDQKPVLDRIVPGYYHHSQNLMMGKLMTDSVALWASRYRIDSFRVDPMGYQPGATLAALQERVDKAAGRKVQLITSQLSRNGTGIGTFNDRARDYVRGGPGGEAQVADLMHAADMVRARLAGSIRSYSLPTFEDRTRQLRDLDDGGQPAGYASEPGEVVNYLENHDNQTLFDINVLKLPPSTSAEDRARVQVLGMALDAFSQGVAYFHAGIDVLRSKSLDRNSLNSGDWFNRIDWSYQDNYFGTGLPPQDDNGKDWPLLKPLLANPAIKPKPADIAFARDAFRDLLRIRASSTLFRMHSATEIGQRLRFFNTGSQQEPTVIAAHLDGRGDQGAAYQAICFFVNVDRVAHVVSDPQARGKRMRLHPVHLAPGAADKRAASAGYDSFAGRFSIPPRTAVVFVEGEAVREAAKPNRKHRHRETNRQVVAGTPCPGARSSSAAARHRPPPPPRRACPTKS